MVQILSNINKNWKSINNWMKLSLNLNVSFFSRFWSYVANLNAYFIESCLSSYSKSISSLILTWQSIFEYHANV